MILHGIDRKLPPVFLEFDEPLHELDGILEMNIHIDNTMTDEKRPFEPLGKVKRRTAPVCNRILLRDVQDG